MLTLLLMALLGGPDVATCDSAVAATLAARARHMSPTNIARTATTLCRESTQMHLDPVLVLALIDVESSFDATATSTVGAQGLMQLMPPTGELMSERYGIPIGKEGLNDPVTNVTLGIRYLAELRDMFRSLDTALLAYNIGPPAVQAQQAAGRLGNPHTRSFAAKVWRHHAALLQHIHIEPEHA